MARLAAGRFGEVCVYGTHFSHYVDAEDPERRQRQAQAVLDQAHEDVLEGVPVLVSGDFNQQRQADYSRQEWQAIRLSMEQRGQPENDGVDGAMGDAGFVCCYDATSAARHNWEGPHPPPTHWTSTVVDYTYAHGATAHGVYVGHSALSDHQPVVTDWTSGREEA